MAWHDMRHVTHGGGCTISTNFNSPALMVWEWDRQCFEDSELKNDLIFLIIESMNDKVYRTALTRSVNYFVFLHYILHHSFVKNNKISLFFIKVFHNRVIPYESTEKNMTISFWIFD